MMHITMLILGLGHLSTGITWYIMLESTIVPATLLDFANPAKRPASPSLLRPVGDFLNRRVAAKRGSMLERKVSTAMNDSNSA